MSTSDKTIDPRILEVAKAEFLSKPYKEVSLREICQKAGVTTGAFYKRYANKEALFDVIVAPTLELVNEYANGRVSCNYDQLDKKDMKTVWDQTAETQKFLIDMLYDNREGFQLLLCHAEGTKYSNFIHDFVNGVTQVSMSFIREVHARGIIDTVIEEEELHMLYTAYWTTMFEPLIHGLSREKALQHSEIVAKLFNWTAVLGF